MARAVQRQKRRQAREETRAQILAAAEEFLRQRSFRELSVDELMALTGHSRTVFYRHFDDLPDVAVRLLETIGAELYEISQAWADSESSDAGDRRALERIVDFFVRHGPLVRSIAEGASHDVAIELIYRRFIDMFIEMTERSLEERVEMGRVQPLDAREVARALTWMNERYFLESFGREPQADPKRALEAVWTIWRRTLYSGPPAGDG
jgi:TetR/AcrR family transcriptional regulator, ethionamide resistance regulator